MWVCRGGLPEEYGISLYLIPFPFARCNLGSEKFFVERDKPC